MRYTSEQFAVWKPDHRNPFEGRRQPAASVSWFEAIAFCSWLTERFREQLPAGYTATLPTEAQWEYACRAAIPTQSAGRELVVVTDTDYYTGDGEEALKLAGWYYPLADPISTREVGLKQPNGWELFDMHGYVWEWCRDVYGSFWVRPDGTTNPEILPEHVVPDEDEIYRDRPQQFGRAVRGGSWRDSASACESANRK